MKKSTWEYYKNNPEAKEKKDEYQKRFNKTVKQIKNRIALNKVNRDRGTYGNGDKLDASHTKRGIVMMPQSRNRGNKTSSPGDRNARG